MLLKITLVTSSGKLELFFAHWKVRCTFSNVHFNSSELLQVVGVLWELPKVSSYVFARFFKIILKSVRVLFWLSVTIYLNKFFKSQDLSSVPQTTGGLSLNKVANPFQHNLMASVKLDVLIIRIREGEQITNLNWLRYIQRPLFKSKILNEKTSYLEFWFFIRFFISVMLWDYCKCHSWRKKKHS